MSEIAAQVLDFIVEQYGTATACRGLWQWAGGKEEAIDFAGTPRDTWTSLWGLADAGEGSSHISLIREMLYDRPGHPLLLDFLVEAAAERFASEQETVPTVMAGLRTFLSSASDVAALVPILQPFPGTSWEAAFASFAPAIQEELSSTERDRLVANCRTLIDNVALLDSVYALHERVQQVEPPPDNQAKRELFEAMLPALKALQAQIWDNELTLLLEKIHGCVERACASLGGGSETADPALLDLDGVMSSTPAQTQRTRLTSLSEVGRGLLAGVWGTRPGHEGEPPTSDGGNQHAGYTQSSAASAPGGSQEAPSGRVDAEDVA